MGESHQHEPEEHQVQVDANKMIQKLRKHRVELMDQLDMVTLAYEDQLEQNAGLLAQLDGMQSSTPATIDAPK